MKFWNSLKQFTYSHYMNEENIESRNEVFTIAMEILFARFTFNL